MTVHTQLRPLKHSDRPALDQLGTHALHLLRRLLSPEAREHVQVLARLGEDVGVWEWRAGVAVLVRLLASLDQAAQDHVRFGDGEAGHLGVLSELELRGGLLVAGGWLPATGERRGYGRACHLDGVEGAGEVVEGTWVRIAMMFKFAPSRLPIGNERPSF